jgi:hypothetical protein
MKEPRITVLIGWFKRLRSEYDNNQLDAYLKTDIYKANKPYLKTYYDLRDDYEDWVDPKCEPINRANLLKNKLII